MTKAKRSLTAMLVFLMVISPFALAQESASQTPVIEKIASADPIITVLDIRDLDIKDAIKLIAQKSGLNIVANNSVQGRVTIYLENIHALDALATVLQITHSAYVDNGGVLQVITEQEYQSKYGRPFNEKLSNRLFHLKGLKASAAAILLEHFKNPFGKIVADDISGTVYVEDTPSKVKEIEEYLGNVDRPIETRVYALRYIESGQIGERLNGLLTNGLGSIRTDKQSNKIFVTDISVKLDEVEKFLKEVDVPRVPVVFELSYGKADEISAVIKSYSTPEIGTMEINKRTNQIIIVDTKSKIKELSELIKQLDRKEKEVLIEARIIQVVLKDEFKMGVDWNAVIRNAHGLELKTTLGISSSREGSLAIGTLSNDNYRAVVEALGNINKSHILSNPRIAVINNEEARILVGTTKPYVTSTTTTSTTGPATVAEDVKFIDVGVKLVVTPTIHPDGYVTMIIRPEVSSASTSITTGQNNVIPIVDKSQVETTVRVKDGVTIVIGGLIKNERTGQVSKVPVLGDIPVLGHAFKNTNRNKEQTEIIIFLTPKIISGDLT